MRQEEKKYWDKARALISQMTLDEKIHVIHGVGIFQSGGVERLGIPPLVMSDGPMGVRMEFKKEQWIPCGYSGDYVTYLPCNSAVASTWNRQLARETGSVLGEEARGRGKDVILAPGINIKRSPLCGRNFEYFSEDPFLTAELAVPMIEGIQEWDVAACVKHFAANNQETQRLMVDVQIEEEALRQIYLPAFEAAVKRANAYSIMGAYNQLRGEHCCQSQYLLKDILRGEWEYDGVVISDWCAVHDTVKAAESELTIEMSVLSNFDEYFMADPLKEKILAGEIPEEVVDRKVAYILVMMQRLHMLDGERKAGTYNTPEHRQKALDTARESVILLKNEDNLLPLDPHKVKKLLVIGENAVYEHANGGGSAEIKALYEMSPFMGIQTLLGGNAKVTYVPGYCREEKKQESETNWQETSMENGGGQTRKASLRDDLAEKRKSLREEAVNLAKEYEYVVFVGGLNHEHDSEGNDRADMKLPYEQDVLIKELLQVNPNTVVTFVAGSAIEMREWIQDAKAVLFSWYAGIEGGRAFAENLFGQVNPSGKLPETFYRSHMDCSAHAVGEFPGGETVAYTEGVFVGYRYQDAFGINPEFCFGHGLSYTTFAYSNPLVEHTVNGCGCTVSCEITNTGKVAGKEIVQVYLASKHRNEKEAVQELRGFEKIELQPGETKRVQITLPDWDEEKEIRLGSSSRDIRCVIS